MPRSRKRKGHHDYKPVANAVKSRKNKSAVLASLIFFALIGVGIVFFAAGSSPLWLIIGAIAGAAGGYFFGKQVDRSMAKK